MEAIVEAIGEDSWALASATELLVIRYLFLTDPDAFLSYLNGQLRLNPKKREMFGTLYGNWLEQQPDGRVTFNDAFKVKQERRALQLGNGFYSQK